MDPYSKPNMNQENPPPYSAQPAYAYPPGQNYPPQSYAPGATVVHATVLPTVIPAMVPVVVGQSMGSDPSNVTCKSCNQVITTQTKRRATVRTHLFAALLCLLGCWLCVCVPYCVDSCNNIDHYCPNCNSYIGAYIN